MNRMATYVAAGLGAALLAACQRLPPLTPPRPSTEPAPPAASTSPARPAASIDDYKVLVAQQILDANSAITFSGRLPPMLPAIVVVNISVGKDGDLSSVAVKRSRDGEASKVALEAVRRVRAPFPRPAHLLHRGHKTLDFSETFLFNEHYQFQLRTLAGPQ